MSTFIWLFFLFSFYHRVKATGVQDFVYYNSGTTRNDQNYGLVGVNAIYNEGYQFKDDPLGSNNFHVGSPLTYLFEIYKNKSIGTPSNGMRSSVALGPIGQGSFEIRGDGRMTDVTIFNNGPNAEPSQLAHKWDLNDAIFGFGFQNAQNSLYKIFQTSPLNKNMVNYSIESLTYSGSYPTSRLMAKDDQLLNNIGIKSINLTAFHSFELHNTNASSIPAVIFWFDIDNRNNNKDIEMDFFFNWPDIIDLDTVSVNNKQNGIFMNKLYNDKNATYFSAGNMSFTLQSCDVGTNQCNTPITGSLTSADNIFTNWETFMQQNEHKQKQSAYAPYNLTIYKHYAFISKNSIKVAANSVYSFSGILSWFFPYRTFNNNKQYLGNYYNTLYGSSDEVNNDIINKLPNIISNIISWQQLFDKSEMYPNFLKDVYLNGPGYISRTSFYLQPNSSNNDTTGIWRQAESWSCFQIDPPHIHGYRSLAYNLIFGNELDRGTLNMYTYGQIDNGLVSELFGGTCFGISGIMGEPSGGARGDDNSIYVLDMYSQFKWYKDGVKYVGDRYKYVKAAMNWIIQQSIPKKYGLPYRLVNTNDEHGVIGDVNTYNSMLYISALYAMKIMATNYEPNNSTYINSLDMALKYANGNLTKLLWQPNDNENDDGFYISFWCANGNYSQYGLQSDVLYGYLWTLVLDLDQYWTDINISTIVSHLKQEKLRNWSQFGLVFMTNRTTSGFNCNSKELYTGFEDIYKELGAGFQDKELGAGFQDKDTWEMATLDHAAILLFLNKDNINESLSMAQTGIDKYRNLFRDQWDWRDTSSTYNDSDPEYSRPVVNSHYCRQLIHYSINLALNGQKLNVNPKTNKMTLILNPVISINKNNGDCIPVLMPQSTFLLCFDDTKNCFEANGLFGNVIIDTFAITNNGKQYNFTNVNIEKSKVTELCI